MPSEDLSGAAAAIRDAASVVALTGAGISAESGVPTFRGQGGLWKQCRPEDLATPQAFARDPTTVWEWYLWRRSLIAAVRPNPGHDVLARLEARLSGFQVVTQNVDGLHQRAGSRRVRELHGSIWLSVCSQGCGRSRNDAVCARGDGERQESAPESTAVFTPLCECGALLRPGVVWFGEPLDPEVINVSIAAVESADVCLVGGTSSLVYPAAGLPGLARQAGAVVIEVNVEPTPLTPLADFVLTGPAGVVLPQLEGYL
jgi:NAD-dependent deacetylase